MTKLLNAFSPVSLEEWKARLNRDLKGRTFEDLSSRDNNGILISPFYNGENGRQGPSLTYPSDWEICSRFKVGEANEANRAALKALQEGASGIIFQTHADTSLEKLLENIDFPYIHLVLDLPSENTGTAINHFNDFMRNRALPEGSRAPLLFYDPLNNQLKRSLSSFSWKTTNYAETLQEGFPYTQVTVDGRCYHNAGANSITQLAATLSHLNEYLNALKEAGRLDIVGKIHIRMATGTLFFEEIAKLRAFRKLFTLLTAAYELQPELHLHVSAGMLHRMPFDIHNNLLRDTVAGMAAVLGGCDSLEIPAFDFNKEGRGNQSDRLSRNQQLIFKEESYLNCVADAAGGSFYLEELTEQFAGEAWKAFQQLEQDGGFIETVRSGILPEQIRTQADKLIEAYRSGEKVLLGVNKYPNPADPPQSGNKTKKESILPELNLWQQL